ncbi:MAG TPA: hypothetical protein VGM26_10050 [Rhizomicrobium sp.]|jgi:hypothetical protein
MKRRAVIAGVAAAGAAVAAGVYRFTDFFVKHYPPTPYDDMLAQLVDRERASKLGTAAALPADANTLAGRLRAMLGSGSIAAAAEADVAANRVSEIDGWVLPESLVLLSALAAKV